MSEEQNEDAPPATTIIAGVSVLVVGALGAWLSGFIVPWLDRLLLAVGLGALGGNIFGVPQWLEPGIRTHKVWLGAGIVLMGVSVSLGSLVSGGAVVLTLVVGVVCVTVLLAEGLARNVFGIGERLGSLLAVGAGICGVSAVVAVAGSISADDEMIAYAAGTVLLFDAVTLGVYSAIGSLLVIPEQVFGIWAGVSMFSTGPAVAAGFSHSEVAGQWATVTKLARNALIGGVVLVYASYYARRVSDTETSLKMVWTEFPKFVFGFLGLAVGVSLGLLTADQVTALENTYDWLFLLAFVGLGTELRVDVFADAGMKPILVILVTWSVIASITLCGSWLLFG